MDDLFQKTLDKVYQNRNSNGIGTLSEKTLHAFIKHFVEPNESFHEIKLNKHVVDIFDGSHIYEIQTRQFFKLIPKLNAFLDDYPLTIIYPIPYQKSISWINLETGEVSKARKSPKVGQVIDVITELYSIKSYLKHPHLSIQLLFFNLHETRYLNGWSIDKKKGAHRADRTPQAFVKRITLDQVDDYDLLLPKDCPQTFTSATLKTYLKSSPKKIQTCLNVLNSLNRIEVVGKEGRHRLYRRVDHKSF